MESELPMNRLDRLQALERLDALDWVDCPQCGLPAYVVDRFVRPSTDGPLPHAVTVCARLHHLCTTDESAGEPPPASTPASTPESTEESAGQLDAGAP